MESIEKTQFESGYSQVNGLRMYYEVYGKGKPLILIHGEGPPFKPVLEK
jgi:pimeloyl-ACP methyl ester carboxylesterase